MASVDKKFQSPLARARGLGSTHEGAGTWLVERVSALALIPLCLWLVYSVFTLRGAAYTDFIIWILEPCNAILLLATIGFGFYHAALGLKVVIEDYVSCHVKKFLMITGVNLGFILMFAASVFSILKVAL